MYTRLIRHTSTSLPQFRMFFNFSASNYSGNSQDHKSNEHLIKSDAKKDENESSDTSTTPCDRAEQTVSGNTNQIAHSTTAYDKDAVNPDQEIEKMKEKNHQDSLDLSAANPRISTTSKDSSLPARK
ncbi:12548_t:CDS:2 [Cetraspora pellucida]|uniref:12548_t:CDS:1 n=1 Tax=Cetraspora pellucida TaxID=1433469 RepID=A0A9N9BNJ1_9GLOM|nr:12548_t:CDS:2 [Cetraspora pellucida]